MDMLWRDSAINFLPTSYSFQFHCFNTFSSSWKARSFRSVPACFSLARHPFLSHFPQQQNSILLNFSWICFEVIRLLISYQNHIIFNFIVLILFQVPEKPGVFAPFLRVPASPDTPFCRTFPNSRNRVSVSNRRSIGAIDTGWFDLV